MKKDLRICAMLDCNQPLGPDALEFTHKGEAIGGICEQCMANEPAIRVLFTLGENKLYQPEEMIALNKTL